MYTKKIHPYSTVYNSKKLFHGMQKYQNNGSINKGVQF